MSDEKTRFVVSLEGPEADLFYRREVEAAVVAGIRATERGYEVPCAMVSNSLESLAIVIANILDNALSEGVTMEDINSYRNRAYRGGEDMADGPVC